MIYKLGHDPAYFTESRGREDAVRPRHHNCTFPGVRRVRSDGDLDPLAEGGEEPEEAVEGVAFHTASDERGDLGLIEPEQSGGGSLRELPLGNETPDALDEFVRRLEVT